MSYIRIKIFGTIILIVILITAASGYVGYQLSHDQILALVTNDASQVGKVTSELLSREIHTLKNDLRNISRELKVYQEAKLISHDPRLDIFLERKAKEFNYLSLALADHQRIIAAYGKPLPKHKHLTNEYALRALQGEAVVSTTEYTLEGELVIRIYASARGNLLIATLPGLYIDTLLAKFRSASSNIFVVDKTGTMISNIRTEAIFERRNHTKWDGSREKARINSFFTHMISEEMGYGFYDYMGVERVAVHLPIAGSDRWSLGVAVPLIESVITPTRNSLITSSLIMLSLGAFVAIFAARQIARPLYTVKKQNESLRKLSKVADAASDAKSHFIANTSHEMRTPLNAIIGLSELILNSEELEKQLPQEVINNIDKIHVSGRTLLAIINDILDISKIESGKFELLPVDYDLPSLINDTVSQNIVRIIDRPIQFHLKVDPSLPDRLMGDEIRIKQIFNNLLSNAFKYTKEGSVQWFLTCHKEDGAFYLVSHVQDTGIGIHKEDMEELFADYTQVDMKSNRKIEGTGLGLSITKKIVEMMDGAISVESIYGEGSRFSVRFRQELTTDTVIGETLAQTLESFNYISNKRSKNALTTKAWLPNAKVLVVDDVQTNLDVSRGIMKPYGMQVDCVLSGEAAIRLIREAKTKYDAIFMDHMMPDMDGIEATRIIREEIGTEYARTIPIIALTANAVTGNEEFFLEHGFQAFISKPIDIIRMDTIINHWIRDKISETQQANMLAPSKDTTACTARASQCQLGKKPLKIEGIDVEKGLARFGGDLETYIGVLHSYLANLPRDLDRIRTPTENDLRDYAIIVHGIKGSSLGIEARELGQKAQALELSSKADDFEFVLQNNPAFIRMAEQLLEALKTALAPADTENGSARDLMDAPEEALLEKMRNAAANFQLDEMEEIQKELERFQYQSENDLVAWLKEHVALMDFSEIRDRLSQRKGKMP